MFFSGCFREPEAFAALWQEVEELVRSECRLDGYWPVTLILATRSTASVFEEVCFIKTFLFEKEYTWKILGKACLFFSYILGGICSVQSIPAKDDSPDPIPICGSFNQASSS